MEGNHSIFLLGVTVKIPPLPLVWKSSTPFWVEQWPITGERLKQAKSLVLQQLKIGQIEPSTSPWNTLIFTIAKKS